MFSPACVYCGARLIQRLGNTVIDSVECRDRRRAVLADWMAHGHIETELRALASGSTAIGPEPSTASAPPTPKKLR